jgi:transcriptional regulator with XRE-family HTH domain
MQQLHYVYDTMFVRIRNLREDNDKTQKEIAEYLFCDQSLYSKYERGIRDVPVEIIIKLAKLYQTSTDYILGLTDNKEPYK